MDTQQQQGMKIEAIKKQQSTSTAASCKRAATEQQQQQYHGAKLGILGGQTFSAVTLHQHGPDTRLIDT